MRDPISEGLLIDGAPKLGLGFFIQPVHPTSRRYADVLREDQEAVLLADRLGYREAFIGEHLSDAAEPITSSLAFIASLSGRCSAIALGTGVLALPNYHPAVVAAQVAMIDHLVDGRFLFGIGPGVPTDAEVVGDLQVDRRRKLLEALDHVLRVWSGEPPYGLQGEFYRLSTEVTGVPETGQGIILRPLQRPHPPIVITSVRPDSKGPELAGTKGWGGISATYVPTSAVRCHIERYSRRREAAGLGPSARAWRVARSIFVADDDTAARRYAHAEAGPYGQYFRLMMSKLFRLGAHHLFAEHPGQAPGEISLSRTLERQVIAGCAERVADEILELREEVGPFGTLLYTGHDWADEARARRSMELMAKEVWPRLSERLAAE